MELLFQLRYLKSIASQYNAALVDAGVSIRVAGMGYGEGDGMLALKEFSLLGS